MPTALRRTEIKVKSTTGISPVMRELSEYIAHARGKPLPARVLEKTTHHVLDTIAAMISGTTLMPGKSAIAYVRALGGSREATVVGSRIVTNAGNAALANAMLAHADETDDTHAPSSTHPGCGIVAATLAMAEKGRCHGMALLRAVALGYDVSARLSLSLGAGAFRKVGHLPQCFGPTFGAAAAGAALAGLNARQVRHVLSYAAQQASGLSSYPRDIDHIEKAFDFGGMAARNGVAAATMVAAGCTGVDDVFSGERNFFQAYDESSRTGCAVRPRILVDGLGETFEIMNTSIKRWTVGAPIQAPLDALQMLIRGENVKAEDVAKMVIRTYAGGATITDNRKMSDINIQHLCAIMLLDGTVTFDSSHDKQRLMDPGVLALRRRISLVADEALEKLRPARHGIVELTLKDGRQLRHHTSAVLGSPRNPMSRTDVEEKSYHLMAPVLGTRRARSLCKSVLALAELRDVRALRPLLQR